jgi:hypothetical protein
VCATCLRDTSTTRVVHVHDAEVPPRVLHVRIGLTWLYRLTYRLGHASVRIPTIVLNVEPLGARDGVRLACQTSRRNDAPIAVLHLIAVTHICPMFRPSVTASHPRYISAQSRKVRFHCNCMRRTAESVFRAARLSPSTVRH